MLKIQVRAAGVPQRQCRMGYLHRFGIFALYVCIVVSVANGADAVGECLCSRKVYQFDLGACALNFM